MQVQAEHQPKREVFEPDPPPFRAVLTRAQRSEQPYGTHPAGETTENR